MNAFPNLPKPSTIIYDDKMRDVGSCFSADQMFIYASSAVLLEREACASMMDLMCEAMFEQIGTEDVTELNNMLRRAVAELGFAEAAKMIRARTDTQK